MSIFSCLPYVYPLLDGILPDPPTLLVVHPCIVRAAFLVQIVLVYRRVGTWILDTWISATAALLAFIVALTYGRALSFLAVWPYLPWVFFASIIGFTAYPFVVGSSALVIEHLPGFVWTLSLALSGAYIIGVETLWVERFVDLTSRRNHIGSILIVQTVVGVLATVAIRGQKHEKSKRDAYIRYSGTLTTLVALTSLSMFLDMPYLVFAIGWVAFIPFQLMYAREKEVKRTRGAQQMIKKEPDK